MMQRAIVATVFAVLSAGVMAQEPAKPIDYDTYCKIADGAAKKAAFMATTAENRGTLVRTQLERWRDANQARLDEKQKAVLAELIQATTAETYADGPQGEAARLKGRAIIARFEPLFTQSDIMAMQPDAPCIAKKDPIAPAVPAGKWTVVFANSPDRRQQLDLTIDAAKLVTGTFSGSPIRGEVVNGGLVFASPAVWQERQNQVLGTDEQATQNAIVSFATLNADGTLAGYDDNYLRGYGPIAIKRWTWKASRATAR